MSTWLSVLSSLGAAIIGGIIAPQFLQAQDRRKARASVREKLTDVERLRWANESYLGFRAALAAFEAAAMIARVPRKVTMTYINAAERSRKASHMIYQPELGEEPEVATVDYNLNKDALRALDRVSISLWHPWTSRVTIRMGTGDQLAQEKR